MPPLGGGLIAKGFTTEYGTWTVRPTNLQRLSAGGGGGGLL
jgi:hypothetical protein